MFLQNDYTHPKFHPSPTLPSTLNNTNEPSQNIETGRYFSWKRIFFFWGEGDNSRIFKYLSKFLTSNFNPLALEFPFKF